MKLDPEVWRAWSELARPDLLEDFEGDAQELASVVLDHPGANMFLESGGKGQPKTLVIRIPVPVGALNLEHE